MGAERWRQVAITRPGTGAGEEQILAGRPAVRARFKRAD